MIGGTYQAPRVRLPGAGGAPEIATAAKSVAVILKHSRRAFVETLDFVTSSGYMDSDSANRNLARHGRGPTIVITDLGILISDPTTHELVLNALHPGVSVTEVTDATGWTLKVAPAPESIPPPTQAELEALRDLAARTAMAHGRAVAAE
jgi:glutaconate CoA-transferase, subunit B